MRTISRGKSSRMELLPPPSLLRPLRLPRLTEVVLSTITQSRMPLRRVLVHLVYHCEMFFVIDRYRDSPRFPNHVTKKKKKKTLGALATYISGMTRKLNMTTSHVIACYRDTIKCLTVASVTNEVAVAFEMPRFRHLPIEVPLFKVSPSHEYTSFFFSLPLISNRLLLNFSEIRETPLPVPPRRFRFETTLSRIRTTRWCGVRLPRGDGAPHHVYPLFSRSPEERLPLLAQSSMFAGAATSALTFSASSFISVRKTLSRCPPPGLRGDSPRRSPPLHDEANRHPRREPGIVLWRSRPLLLLFFSLAISTSPTFRNTRFPVGTRISRKDIR